MTKVVVDKNKIDLLANAISNKSGESLTMTLDEMVEAVDGIQTGGGGITPTGNIDITQAGVTDVTNYATATVPQGDIGVGLSTGQYYTENSARKWRIRAYGGVETGDDEGTPGFIADHTVIYSDYLVRNAVASGTTITPTTSSQTIGGQNYMMEGAVTVSAMPSGSVTAPASITGSSATVSTGTNTLTLSKTVSITPNVTTAGYVSSGTAGNSNVSLTASVTTQGAQTIYPSATQQTIASGRYLTGTQTIAPVTTTNLTADNIKSGVTVKVGDASDDDRVISVTGTYSGGGGSALTKLATKNLGTISTSSTSAADTGQTLAITATDYKDYDFLVAICHTSPHTNGRHVATVRIINFSATSPLTTKTATQIATSTQH